MRIAQGTVETRSEARDAKLQGRRVGLVPTMGALHDGHISLVRAAKEQSDFVVVSIFVNPTQFGPNEDLGRYPRPFERDCKLLEAEGVQVLFAPSADEMYPPNGTTLVEVEGMSGRLCGASRPGHFRGVTTVVAKLFNIVGPDVAFFGQKDAAQVGIIRRMVCDLNFDVQIAVGAIIREADGLAMSSRNQYLDPQQRKAATILYRALMRVQRLADRGEYSSAALLEGARAVMAEEPGARLE